MLADDRLEEAEQEITNAHARLAELATTLAGHELPLAGNLASHFVTRAACQIPTLPERTQRQREKQHFGGLTAREREVAALVVQGKTNREIAEALVLSERTAERHIANIMTKLGFNSRAQIAVWATERGLK